MSALGEYVHLITENYLKFGTYRTNEGMNSYQPISNFMNLRTAHLSTISENTIAKLKMRIANDSVAQEQRDMSNLSKQYQENLDNIYKTLAQYTSINLLNVFTYMGDNKFKPSSQEINNTALSKKALKNKVKIIQEIREKIRNINQGKKNAESEENIKALLNLYNKLEISDVRLTKNNMGSIKSAVGKIQAELNNIVYDTAVGNVAGRFGEELVYSARDVADNLVMTALGKELKQGIVGDEKTAINIETDLFSTNMDSIFRTRSTSDENGSRYTLTPTQDKVDVQILLNEENVFASVKDYLDPSKKPPTLQKDMSLLYPLTYLNKFYDEFGNHWLNMHAGRLLRNRDNADLILQQELAYEALVSGNPFKRGAMPSNTFIVISRTTGQVFVKNTKDILLQDFYNFNFSLDISKIKLKNERALTIDKRINNLMAQIHQIKLSVHYKLTEFDF